MRQANFWRSGLTNVPDGVFDDPDTETLNLAENALRSVPDRFGGLQRLRMLDLGHNQLQSIPDSIGQLVNLVRDGEPLRMSKRAGTVVMLEDFVEALGVDAARYALARYSSDSSFLPSRRKQLAK